jgi:hypothetical protein
MPNVMYLSDTALGQSRYSLLLLSFWSATAVLVGGLLLLLLLLLVFALGTHFPEFT